MALNGEIPQDSLLSEKVKRLLPLLKMDGKRLILGKKTCIPRKHVRDILNWVHDSKLGGHLGFSKTLGLLESYHWKHKK